MRVSFVNVLSICMCASFHFGFADEMWDVILLVPDHCRFVYFSVPLEKCSLKMVSYMDFSFQNCLVQWFFNFFPKHLVCILRTFYSYSIIYTTPVISCLLPCYVSAYLRLSISNDETPRWLRILAPDKQEYLPFSDRYHRYGYVIYVIQNDFSVQCFAWIVFRALRRKCQSNTINYPSNKS